MSDVVPSLGSQVTRIQVTCRARCRLSGRLFAAAMDALRMVGAVVLTYT